MSAAIKHPPERMTTAEFLQWDPDGCDRWQLVDGEPVAMGPSSVLHGAVQSELVYLLTAHLRAQGGGCIVVTAPGIIPRIRASENFRIPDLGVTCSARRDGHELQEPVLLIEILSPSNAADTRRNVWSYTTIPSVREILVVHSARIEAELLHRDGDWPLDPELLGPDAALRLDAIGFAAPLRDVYRTSGLT
jgi:Uma2 family endonuclease